LGTDYFKDFIYHGMKTIDSNYDDNIKKTCRFFFSVPAVACNRRRIEEKKKEIKSNRHSAHLVVFLLSHAREKEENHHSFLHPYVFARSLAKNAQLSPAAYTCVYEGAYE
jgi:hypothetical protein